MTARAPRPLGITPFVNRAEERQLLQSRFEQAADGEGQVVLLAGEPGIGKSRLVHAFREDIADTAHTWLEAGGAAQYVDTPFHVWNGILRQVLGWGGDGDASQDRARALEREVARAGLDPDRAVPYLAPLLGVPVPDDYPPVLATPEVTRRRLLAMLLEWVLGLARHGPLVILLEDLHWVDPSTIELQTLLAQQGAAEPLLLLYTARPDFEVPWPERVHHTHLTLNRLLKRHVRDMVLEVAARAALLADIVDQLEARADGVPLFVEELTRGVIESGVSAVREIPATLVDSLTARIDRLGPDVKAVAQAGAVCGREFSYGLLRRVHPVEGDQVDQALRALVDAEMLYVRGFAPESTYTFKHALVQDAAYASLSEGRRRALHGDVAVVLRTHYADLADQHPELLAQHHAAAGELDAAIAKSQEAGERALRRGALAEAERHFERALKLLAELPTASVAPSQELALRLALGRVLLLTKGYTAPETLEAYARARALSERVVGDPDHLVQLLNGLWLLSLVREGAVSARPLADAVMRAATRSGSAWWLGMGHLAMGMTAFHAGDFASARQHLAEARSGLRGEPPVPVPAHPGVLANGYGIYMAWHRGLIREARASAAEAAELAQSIGRAPERALAAQMLAVFHATMTGDLDAAEMEIQRGIAACAEQPNPVIESVIRVLQGSIRAQRGHAASAVPMIREALDTLLATGQRLGIPLCLGLLIDAQVMAGQGADALRALDESLALCESEASMWSAHLRRRAEVWQLVGAPAADVEVAYRESIARARSDQSPAFELRAASSYARWLAAHARAGEAAELLGPLVARFADDDDSVDLRRARAMLSAAHPRTGPSPAASSAGADDAEAALRAAPERP